MKPGHQELTLALRAKTYEALEKRVDKHYKAATTEANKAAESGKFWAEYGPAGLSTQDADAVAALLLRDGVSAQVQNRNLTPSVLIQWSWEKG